MCNILSGNKTYIHLIKIYKCTVGKIRVQDWCQLWCTICNNSQREKKLKKGSENKNIQVHTYNKLTLYETLK